MAEQTQGLTIELSPNGRNEFPTLVANFNGSVIERSKVDLDSLAARSAFCESVHRKCPVAAVDEIDEHLLRLSVELASKPSVENLVKQIAAIPRFEPFPVDALPELLQSFVRAVARSIGCDAIFVTLPMLAILASAIGNTRRIKLKADWTEPSVLWTAPIAESGDGKSPAMKAALLPLYRRQEIAIKDFAVATLDFEAHLDEYETTTKGKPQAGEPKPIRPLPPVLHHVYVNDCTVEALIAILADSPRGGMQAMDELSGWFGGLDAYRGGKGGDAAKYLSMFGAGPVKCDRKTGARLTYAPRSALPITGTIQPKVLQKSVGDQHVENGMAARFLLGMPPSVARQWTDYVVPRSTLDNYARLIDKLFELQFAAVETADDAAHEPIDLPLTDDAKDVFVPWYNRLKAATAEKSGATKFAWSKMEGQAARLALVIQLCRNPDAVEVDAEAITAGCRMADWFAREAERIYAGWTELPEERQQRELIELIQDHHGEISARELAHASRTYRHAGAADAALNGLKAAGLGGWATVLTGGKPKTVFRLSPSGNGNGTLENIDENGTSVTVTAVTAEKTPNGKATRVKVEI